MKNNFKNLISAIAAAAISASLFANVSVGAKTIEGVPNGLDCDFEAAAVGTAPADLTTSNGSILVDSLGDSKVLKVMAYASAYNTANCAFLTKGAITDATFSSNGALTFSISYNFPEALDRNRSVQDVLFLNSKKYFTPYSFTNGKLYKGASATAAAELCEYPIGEWFTLKYTILQGQMGNADSVCSLDMVTDKGTINLFNNVTLASFGLTDEGFSAVSIWQHNFNTKGTQDAENAELNTPFFYVDNMKVERTVQTDGLDVDFDDDYYRVGASPSKVALTSTSASTAKVSYFDEAHKNVMKCTNNSSEFRNSYLMQDTINLDNGAGFVFEYDQYAENGVTTGIFPLFFAGQVGTTSGASAYLFSPFAIKGTRLYSNAANFAGSDLGVDIPLNKWFKIRFTYLYSGAHLSDVVKLELIVDEETTVVYNERIDAGKSWWMHGSSFPYLTGVNKGVGTLGLTIADAGTQYFDNIKVYPAELPSATGVNTKGSLCAGSTVTAYYNFSTPDGGEDASIVKWYRGSNVADGNKSGEDTYLATGKTYTITKEDEGKYITCEVSPKSSTGLEGLAKAVKVISVPGFTYSPQSNDELASKLQVTNTNTVTTVEEIAGRMAIKTVGNGAAAATGSNLQPKTTAFFGGLNTGNITFSHDVYLDKALANGSLELLQLFTTQGTATAGYYQNVLQLKNNHIYDGSGKTVICEVPVGEWFTIKCTIEAVEEPYMAVSLVKANGEESVVWSGSASLKNIETDGLTFFRVSYGCAQGSIDPLYVSDLKISNDTVNGVKKVNVAADGTKAVCTALVTDNRVRGGKLIFAAYNQGKLVSVEIKDIDNTVVDNTITAELADAAGCDVSVFAWDGVSTMAPLFSAAK